MAGWLTKEDKERLVAQVRRDIDAGFATPGEVLKTKMELDAVEAAMRSAQASERNARIMLWSTIFAFASAVASFLSVFVPLFIKH
jgi:hypothetical protein